MTKAVLMISTKRILNSCYVKHNVFLFNDIPEVVMLHWHPSHKSSKPKLDKSAEAIIFYTLVAILVSYLILQFV